jgi:hypothetical protein
MGVSLFCGGLAQADPITIQITGNVTSASGSALPSSIYNGISFTGTYTYDFSAINSSSQNYKGIYSYNYPYGISLTLGGLEFKTEPTQMSGGFEIDIYNDFISNGTDDYYRVHSNINAYTNGLWVGAIFWDLGDSTHTTVSSVDLPIIAPTLIAWNYNSLFINGGDGGVGHVDFGISGIVTEAILIPEPVTGILMAMGMLFIRRR